MSFEKELNSSELRGLLALLGWMVLEIKYRFFFSPSHFVIVGWDFPMSVEATGFLGSSLIY